MAIQSPFPGMDPYLEQSWRDVHQRLVLYGCDQLQEHLPPSLRARVEERVFVEDEEGGYSRSIYPDIRVIGRPERGGGGTALAEPGISLDEPITIHVTNEPFTETFIEIIEVGTGHRVVTVIEVLSPTNKTPGEGRDLYVRKQDELRRGGVSLVEIDLLRDGDYTLAPPYESIPASHRPAPYEVCVRRGWEPDDYFLYARGLRHGLPTIRVPLRQTDPEVPLDLQALIEQAYRNGRYDDIDYRAQPVPPLTGEDAAWADELLRAKGLR